MSWFSRMITLPKAHNSLSDILGADAAHALTQTFHGLVASAVGTALHSVVTAGETELETIAALVNGAVSGVIQGVSPALAAALKDKITNAVKDLEGIIETDAIGATEVIVKAIGTLLKLA